MMTVFYNLIYMLKYVVEKIFTFAIYPYGKYEIFSFSFYNIYIALTNFFISLYNDTIPKIAFLYIIILHYSHLHILLYIAGASGAVRRDIIMYRRDMAARSADSGPAAGRNSLRCELPRALAEKTNG